MEMKYILKNVVFETLQALYMIVWIPIHFSPSDSIWIDTERYELMCWFYVLINLMYYIVFYLDKRHFEMQFNSHVLGAWSAVYEPNSIQATTLTSRENAAAAESTKTSENFTISLTDKLNDTKDEASNNKIKEAESKEKETKAK